MEITVHTELLLWLAPEKPRAKKTKEKYKSRKILYILSVLVDFNFSLWWAHCFLLHSGKAKIFMKSLVMHFFISMCFPFFCYCGKWMAFFSSWDGCFCLFIVLFGFWGNRGRRETRKEKQKLNLLCVYIYIVLLAELCCDVHLFFFIFFIRLTEKNMWSLFDYFSLENSFPCWFLFGFQETGVKENNWNFVHNFVGLFV